MSTTEAIRIGTATTGRLITAAALVLAVVAGAFVFSDLVMMKYPFGLLIALLLDATIVRMFLVPAIMKLLGDDCWWAPRWMKRLQNKLGLARSICPTSASGPRFANRRSPRRRGGAAEPGRPPSGARPVHPGGEARPRPGPSGAPPRPRRRSRPRPPAPRGCPTRPRRRRTRTSRRRRRPGSRWPATPSRTR